MFPHKNIKPTIGIPAHIENQSNVVLKKYTKSICRSGGIPIIIPILPSKEDVKSVVELIDGLLLPGGFDVDPIEYNEEPIPQLGLTSHHFDEFELTLLEEAGKKGIPIFGICRGYQLMNVFFGGNLYQDISTQRESPAPLKHVQAASARESSHFVEIAPGTNLSRLMGHCAQIRVNSIHHQAIRDVAKGFRVTAKASDGVIEGIECEDNPAVFGVQWHPEISYAHGVDTFSPLFEFLIEEALKKKTKNTGMRFE